MSSWNKLVRSVNKANKIMKDTRMVADVCTGNTKRAKRRAKNKVKYKLMNKLFKF